MLATVTRSSFYRHSSASPFQLNNAFCISTNYALDFHQHVWDSFEKRSLKNRELCLYPSPKKSLNAPTETSTQAFNQNKRLRNAHGDLFKYFRARASFRMMKRGDGILSECFSLNACHKKNDSQQVLSCASEIFTLEVNKARRARDDLHQNYWSAHQSRKNLTAQTQFNEEMISLLTEKNRKHNTSFYAVHPEKHRNRAPLPSKLKDIYSDFGGFNNHSVNPPIRRQAMAITETSSPFKIIDVNKAWIDLCGYSRKQAIGSTLKILQGPDTNLHAASYLISSLLAKKATGDSKNEEIETVLTNYRSDGRKFRNHIRLGLLKDEAGKVINFFGVFKKLDDDDEMIV